MGEETKQLQIRMPNIVHAELKRVARKHKMGMGRVLVDAFIETCQEPMRTRMRLNSPSEEESIAARRRSQAARQARSMPMCDECKKQHTYMPNQGPWHEKDCSLWFKRGLGL